MTAKKFYSKLLGSLKQRKDIALKKYKLKYSSGNYNFLRIASKEIGPGDKVILIRAGIHGNEIAGPLTILSCCNEIIDYIHQAGLKCIIYPLGNPSGFEKGRRYHYKCLRRYDGNNDFLRYELEDGKITSDLGSGIKYEKWYWCSEPKLKIRLLQETRLMHKLLREDTLFQISALIDLHQDCESNFPAAAYHYTFGDISCYYGIVEKIERILPILRDTDISAGEKYPQKSDGQGFIARHDGSLDDLMYRLGVRYCVTVETTKATPPETAKKVNLIWIFGITDLLRR